MGLPGSRWSKVEKVGQAAFALDRRSSAYSSVCWSSSSHLGLGRPRGRGTGALHPAHGDGEYGGVTKLPRLGGNTELAPVSQKMAEPRYKPTRSCPSSRCSGAKSPATTSPRTRPRRRKNVFGFISISVSRCLHFSTCCGDGDYYYKSLRDLTPLHDDDKKAIFDTAAHDASRR